MILPLLALPRLFTVAPPLPEEPNDLSEYAESGTEVDTAPTQRKGGRGGVNIWSTQESYVYVCRRKLLTDCRQSACNSADRVTKPLRVHKLDPNGPEGSWYIIIGKLTYRT